MIKAKPSLRLLGSLLGLTLLSQGAWAQPTHLCQTPDCLTVENVHSARGVVRDIGILDTRLHLYIWVPRTTTTFSLGIFDGDDDTPVGKTSSFVLEASDGSKVQELDKLQNQEWTDFRVETKGRWGVWRLSITGPEDASSEDGHKPPKARNDFMARTQGDVDLYLKPEAVARVRGLRLSEPHFGGASTHRFSIQMLSWPRLRLLLLKSNQDGATQADVQTDGTPLRTTRERFTHDDRLPKDETLETVTVTPPGAPGLMTLQISNIKGDYGLGIEQEVRLFCTDAPLMPLPHPIPVQVKAGSAGAAARLDYDSPQTHNEPNIAYTNTHGDGLLWLLPGTAYRATTSRGYEWQAREVSIAPNVAQVHVGLERSFTPPPGWFGGDAHCHTQFYDGTNSPAQMIEAARAAGLSWLVLTEHGHSENIERVERANAEAAAVTHPDGFVVIPGMEYTGPLFHANVLGTPVHVPSGASLDDVVAAANRADSAQQPCVAVLNHPTIGKTAANEGRKTPALSLIELWNSSEPAATQLWWQMLNADRRVFALANTDSHNRTTKPLGNPRTYVFLGDQTPSAANIIRALREGRSVLSRGAMLDWTLNSQRPGATIAPTPQLQSHLEVQSARPIERVEIIKDGAVVRSIDAEGKTQFSRTESLPSKGGWYLVRAMEHGNSLPLAMSNPIWVQGTR